MARNAASLIVLATALAMGLIEIAATFAESAYALILAGSFFLGTIWLWLRGTSIAALLAVAVLFALELIYLSDYNWNDPSDRIMILLTVAVCALGLAAVIVSLYSRVRRSTL